MGKQQIEFDLSYHNGQKAIFYECEKRKRVISKGRRWGFTKGAMQYVIDLMTQGVSPVMWGDTVSQNIYSYVERYALPVLAQIPSKCWEWKKQEKKLYIKKSVCDFRSADQPENWEGFGYKVIILNEAGIILKNQYLWNHAVRPMLMDYPDSIAIIGGTPKGKNLFYELYLKEGADPNWASFQFSSYTNPYLSKEEIDDLVSELPETVVRQEIYAEFTDIAALVLIPYELIKKCMIAEMPAVYGDRGFTQGYADLPEVWGLDVARHGDDYSCLARRYGPLVYSLKTYEIQDTMQLASFVNYEYRHCENRPQMIFIETTGIGWGVYDRCRELGCPVYPADVSLKSHMHGVFNKRAEMYVRLKEQMQKNLKIVEDRKLRRQLSNIEFEFTNKSELKLIEKAEIKKNLGESPDIADALALTFYEEVTIPGMEEGKPRERYKPKYAGRQGVTWMSR